nr:hypothetical protein [Escherichia coli]
QQGVAQRGPVCRPGYGWIHSLIKYLVEERNNGMIALYYLPDVKPYPVLFLQNQQRIYKVRKAVQAQFRSVQALHAKRFAYYG